VKPYPLDHCLVSGDKLDAMGGAITWVYAGQEFKFCCKSCPKNLLKDPAAMLLKLHDAEAAAAKAAPQKD
jgi:hypothetical protein